MESEDEYKSSEEDSGELLSLNSFSNYETYFNFEPCPIYRLNQQLWFKILYFLTCKIYFQISFLF